MRCAPRWQAWTARLKVSLKVSLKMIILMSSGTGWWVENDEARLRPSWGWDELFHKVTCEMRAVKAVITRSGYQKWLSEVNSIKLPYQTVDLTAAMILDRWTAALSGIEMNLLNFTHLRWTKWGESFTVNFTIWTSSAPYEWFSRIVRTKVTKHDVLFNAKYSIRTRVQLSHRPNAAEWRKTQARYRTRF